MRWPLLRPARSLVAQRCASSLDVPKPPAPSLLLPKPPPSGFWVEEGVRGAVEWDRRRGPPMVWHPDYSIPWPSNHRFAMLKFDDLRLECVRSGLVASERAFFSPDDERGNARLDAAILAAHDEAYVAAVTDGSLDAKLWRRIGFVQRPDHEALMRRTRLEVAGTLKSAELARVHGMAVHLAGGTHHAHRAYGAGYTIFNDLAIAALDHAKRGGGEVLVVDVDVHQGDGTADILGHRLPDGATTWSLHCGENYPFGFNKLLDYLGHDRSTVDTALPRGAGDADVLAAVEDVLPRLLDDVRPTLVLFDAGADAHEVDALGHFNLTDAGVARRDRAVLEACAARDVPVVTVIGGGYDKDRRRLAKRHCSICHTAAQVWTERCMMGADR